MIRNINQYSLSIIIPIMSEINSLKKTLKIIDKIKVKKEYLIIYSKKFTPLEIQKEIFKLKKKYRFLRYFYQKKPFVGGAIDLGIKNSKKKYLAIMAADLETNPNELKNMVILSKKNPDSIELKTSSEEDKLRSRLKDLLLNSKIPQNQILSNLGLFLGIVLIR